MSEVDWSKAPDGADFYSWGSFFKMIDNTPYYYNEIADDWLESTHPESELKERNDFELAPTISLKSPEWPTDDRINIIGTNGGDGQHYEQKPKSSAEFLSECLRIQTERGKQYDANGDGERSFAAAASAFNAVTGKDLKGSDVCLILEMVKLVRQYSSPDRLHEDSVLDKVSYSSLWAEELTKELSK